METEYMSQHVDEFYLQNKTNEDSKMLASFMGPWPNSTLCRELAEYIESLLLQLTVAAARELLDRGCCKISICKLEASTKECKK